MPMTFAMMSSLSGRSPGPLLAFRKGLSPRDPQGVLKAAGRDPSPLVVDDANRQTGPLTGYIGGGIEPCKVVPTLPLAEAPLVPVPAFRRHSSVLHCRFHRSMSQAKGIFQKFYCLFCMVLLHFGWSFYMPIVGRSIVQHYYRTMDFDGRVE
jgi:hypothetical protein